MRYRLGVLSFAVALLVACSTKVEPEKKSAVPGDTLATLKRVDLEQFSLAKKALPRVDIATVLDSYSKVLKNSDDEKLNQQVFTRIADLELEQAQELLGESITDAPLFSSPIQRYELLITQDITAEFRERLLYQLSKAYALDGRGSDSDQALQLIVKEFPQSPYLAEANFRLGERAFSAGEYRQARDFYTASLAAGATGRYYQSALYMKGWAQFKLNQYALSVSEFLLLLDEMAGDADNFDHLSKAETNLAEDSLRAMSIAYSYIGGPDAIREVAQEFGARPYEQMLYLRLGELYESQDRYSDAAETYLSFVKQFPMSPSAPRFSVAAIDTYYRGDFPSKILPSKEAFVELYGKSSLFALQADVVTTTYVEPYLYEYLLELSSYYHASAQQLTAPENTSQQYEFYVRAANYYEQFLTSFPTDEKAPEQQFLQADAYYEAGEYEAAADAFQKAAYHYENAENGADAGYNTVLALDKLIEQYQASRRDVSLLQTRKLDMLLRYADVYAQDPRAVSLLTQAAELMFVQGSYVTAEIAAQRVITWLPAPENELLLSAWLVNAHSAFELKKFDIAEQSYRQYLSLLPDGAPEQYQAKEWIAASLYESAQLLVADDNKTVAIDKLLAVAEIAPYSEIALVGLYDAANYLMELEQWQQAEVQLKRFAERYPTHELTKTIPAKKAFLYQEIGNWSEAADALKASRAYETDDEVLRQSLYLLAELYAKANRHVDSAKYFKRYIYDYKEPKNLRMEAKFQIAEQYALIGEDEKREYWLEQLVKQADISIDRSAYLGAYAATELADQSYNEFDQIKLSLPLKKSLKRKRSAMQNALKGYQKVLSFEVSEFTTKANYKIGNIYASLSQSLLDSDRPSQLDALALEQYEILLEEQAFPFEEQSIEIHEANAQRSWDGNYDEWVKASFDALAALLPGRYRKQERLLEVSPNAQ